MPNATVPTQQFYFAQKAFVVSDGRLLLVRKSDADPNQAGKWEVPGGRMDFGEEVDKHIVREVLEEVGIETEPGAPFHIWQWRLNRTAKDGSKLDIQIVAVARLCRAITTTTTSSNQVAEDFLGEIKWVPIEQVLSYDLIPNMVPAVRTFLSLARKS